jgi:hypothetical protein
VSFPEKFWTLWPRLQWPSLKQKCPSPHPPKPLCSPFSTWHFWPPSKKKRGQSFGGMLGQSSNFFLLQLEHQVIWKLTKAFPKNRIMGTSSAVHLSASVVDTTERGDRGWKKGVKQGDFIDNFNKIAGFGCLDYYFELSRVD